VVDQSRMAGLRWQQRHHDMQNMALMVTFVKIGMMKLKTGLTYMNIQENKILHLNCVNFFWSSKSSTLTGPNVQWSPRYLWNDCQALTTSKLEGEVEDNREKWGDFWEKLIAINQNIVSRPLWRCPAQI
jgi:hypothetical protein